MTARSSRNGPVLHVDAVERTYHLGRSVDVPALRGVSLTLGRGEFVAIVGPSGSGKTTLLNVAGLLDHPNAGEVYLAGAPTTTLGEAQRAKLRRQQLGFIFQSFNLLPHLTAEENVAMPLRYADPGTKSLNPVQLLERVGLGERRRHKPDELSGGEQQRVAIARALVLNPPLLFADEPTGELDSETAEGIHRLLGRLRDAGKAIVVVTHNEELARIAGRTVHMRDGRIVEDVLGEPPPPAAKRRTAKRKSTARTGPRRRSTPSEDAGQA
jgi:putative ABC transport system ATP-binding protein